MAVLSPTSSFRFIAPIHNMGRAVDVLRGLPFFLPAQRVLAAQALTHFVRSQFENDSPQVSQCQALVGSLERTQGSSTNAQLYASLFQLLESEVAAESDVRRIIRPSKPLFEAGPVRFFQSPHVRSPLRPGEPTDDPTMIGGYLLSNEATFRRYYPKVSGIGGVVAGVGVFQNLNLAAAARASGIVFADLSTTVSYTLALMLPVLAQSGSRQDFGANMSSLLSRSSDPAPYLAPVPDDFRLAFECHLDNLRSSREGRQLEGYLRTSLNDPSHFLGSAETYDLVSRIVAQGGAAVIHGNLFGGDMPDLTAGAMSVFDDPLRIFYVSNAPEQVHLRNYDHSLPSLLSVMEGLGDNLRVDPNGLLLMTTEFSPRMEIKRQKAESQDSFTYHAVKTSAASALLRGYGLLAPFISRFEGRLGLNAPQQTA